LTEEGRGAALARAKVVEAKALERQVEGSGVGESEAAEGA
jgi:hypothetical protein